MTYNISILLLVTFAVWCDSSITRLLLDMNKKNQSAIHLHRHYSLPVYCSFHWNHNNARNNKIHSSILRNGKLRWIDQDLTFLFSMYSFVHACNWTGWQDTNIMSSSCAVYLVSNCAPCVKFLHYNGMFLNFQFQFCFQLDKFIHPVH